MLQRTAHAFVRAPQFTATPEFRVGALSSEVGTGLREESATE